MRLFTPEVIALAVLLALIPALPFLLLRGRGEGGGMGRGVQTLHLRIESIADDVLTFAGGRRCAVLEVGSVNFSMLGQDKQAALVAGYEAFLMSLSFKVQTLIRAVPLDLDPYLGDMAARAETEANPALRRLAYDRIGFIRQQATARTLLERRFYLVIPADEPRPGAALPLPRRDHAAGLDLIAATAVKQLSFRCDDAVAQLGRCALKARRLTDAELTELTYACWCPELSRLQRLRQHLHAYLSLVVTTGRDRSPARSAPAVTVTRERSAS